MRSSPRTVPGTGLSPIPYGLLVLFSVALFLFWGGPLWSASHDDSHVGRFAVSYLAVIPAAGLLLLRAHRLTVSHVIAATCSAWGIKLLVTSALYFSLARGTAPAPLPSHMAHAPKPRTPAASAEYRPAAGELAGGSVSGSVLQAGAPVAGAVVVIDRPLPGKPVVPTDQTVRLKIRDAHYAEALLLGRADQSFEVASADTTLHTLHLYEGERAVLNVPVPAGDTPRSFPAPEPGIYEARCDNHPTERATLVVVDHPYATRTGARGDFTLPGVPAGPVSLRIVSVKDGQPSAFGVRRVTARVEAGETTAVHIDLSTPEDAEERL